MGVIDLAEKTAGLIPKPAPELAQATNWIKDAISVINSINQLVTTVNSNPLVQRFTNPGGSQIITSDPTAKAIKSVKQAQIQQTGSTPPPQPNNQDMEAYFSTPEGIKTIVESIDQFSPLLPKGADSSLKDVKDLLNLAIDKNAEKQPQQEKPKKSGKKKKGKKK